ncbi:MAG TPA: HPr family phosphocarrier protein [Candidatus Pullilachnospira intestinigallinarum]|nr:HPr family phosphocarrier protein [Candidatus Pullilachnospira intestinigallinarum]
MIQLPVHFDDVKSAEQFVSILDEFPYACDLISGTQSVDAKSLIGVLALSHRKDLNLTIYEVYSDISEDLLDRLQPYIVGNLKEAVLQSA